MRLICKRMLLLAMSLTGSNLPVDDTNPYVVNIADRTRPPPTTDVFCVATARTQIVVHEIQSLAGDN